MRTHTLFAFVALVASQAAAKLPQPLEAFALAPRAYPAARDVAHHKHVRSASSARARAVKRQGPARLGRGLDVTLLLGQLQSLCGGIQTNQQDIHAARQEIETNPSSAKKYSHDLSNKLSAMRKASGGATPIISDLNTALAPFGDGKGKKYYDSSNALEVLLKDYVDSNKYMLTDLNYIIYKVPGLGPVLGPIVYDIKCLIEELLNGLENTTDGLLNGQGLIGLKGLLNGFDLLGGLGLGL